MNAQERAEAAPKMLFLQIGDDGLAHPTECADTAEVRRAVEAAIYMPGTELDDGESRMLDEITSELLEDGESRFEGDPPLLLFRLAGRAALAAAPQVPAVPQQADDADRLLREVFALCEATEYAPEVEAKNEHQRGFDRGRRFEAKQIRRAIGAWFQDEFCGRSFMGEPTHWMPLPAAPGAPQPAEPAPRWLTKEEIDPLIEQARDAFYPADMNPHFERCLVWLALRAAGVKEPT